MMVRVSGVLGAQIAVLSGLVPICSAQQIGTQQFGVNIHNTQKAQALEDEISPAELGIRADFRWSLMEDGQKGVLHFPTSYDEFDSVVNWASQHGVHPLIILCFGNKFYDDGEQPNSPVAIQAFAKYARFVVAHFKGRANQFEVWNEWNYNSQAKKQPHVWGDAVAYVNLLRVASVAIKTENPSAIVIGGTPGGTDENWINKFIQAGGLAYVDAFAIHPYVLKRMHNLNAPTVAAPPSNPEVKAFIPTPGTPEDSMAWIDHIKARIDKTGGHRTIPIYVTENGWPTNSGELGVPENVEASYLQRFLLMARTRPWIAGVWWYDLMDDGSDPQNPEQRFGLFRQNGDRKPAYGALLQIKDILQSKSTPKQITGSNGEIVITGQYTNGTEFRVVWTPTDEFARSQPSAELDALLHSGFRVASGGTASALGATPILLTK